MGSRPTRPVRPSQVVRRLTVLGRDVRVRVGVRYRDRRVARLLSACGPLLPRKRRQRIVLLASSDRSRQVDAWLDNLSQHRILVVGEGAGRRRRPGVSSRQVSSLAQIHQVMKSFGAVHLLVDLRSEDVAEYRETWAALFFHLRHGGVYLVPRPAGADEAELTAWSAELAASVPRNDPLAGQHEATAGVLLLPDGLAVVKKGHHFLALADDDVATTLPAREPGTTVEVLRELPPGDVESRVTVSSVGATVEIVALPQRLAYPSLRLRHYTANSAPIVFAGRTLMYTGNTILPDSFRFYRADNLTHPSLGSVSHDFRTIRRANSPREDLEGTYFVLDPQWTGHFGHIMTEVVGRLWGWEEAKRRFPDLKVLFAVEPGQRTDPILTRLLSAYGIPESDLVAVDHAVRVRSVVTATAMWHNQHPHFVHPGITEVWDRIAANLATGPAPAHERIFVSRGPTLSARACHNAADVERLFASHGFTVVYPEDLDLAEQAAVFRDATVIAGFSGSAMFNLMYAKRLEHVILLGHEAYSARNEHLYTSLLGGHAHYFWSTPDIPREPGRNNWPALVSNWSFDFERNQEALEKVLADLDR